MKRIYVLILSCVFSLAHLQAQNPVRCYTMESDSMLRAAHPNMGTLQDFENWMQQKLTEQAASGIQNRVNSVRVIPTVVHVIYSNATENISTAQVLSQIQVLNDDFRRLNADTTNTPLAFRPVAADCQIEFCLAQIDPNGNPTDGIDRVSRSGSPFSQGTMDNTIKPATIWDPNQYFNIWVANLSGGLLGWAQFPSNSGLSGLNTNGGSANTDGVVLLYSSVGAPPANPFPGAYNLGRTATHEVGHWVGLRHIWGDGNCSVDDFCNDTPASDASNFGCPTTHISCTTTDMVQNYMDYTDDGCMNLFTQDQKARMDIVLLNSPRRASLLTSTVCNPSGINANFTANATTGCAPMTVQFTNTSFGAITGSNWNFGGLGTSTATNPSFTFNTPGLYTITLTVTDGVLTDTETKVDFIIVNGVGVGQTLPFSEDFEAATFPPTGWTLVNPDNSTTWERVTVGGITPGSNAAKMDYYGYNAAGQRDGMVSPVLDLSGYSSATLDFDHAYRRYNNATTDSLIIYVSTQCGGAWQRIVGWGENGSGTQFRTSSNTTTNWTPSTASHWCFSGGTGSGCKVVDLTPYCGNSNVQIKFEGYNGYSNNLYLDNININGVLAPLSPVANFSSSATSICAGNNVTFTDLSTNTPTSWNWNFGDGNSASTQNPSHVYNTPGTYTVTLTATNASGTDSEIKSNLIIVSPNPTVSITRTNTTCGLNNGIATASASGGSGLTYLWNTGSTASTLNNLAAGTYTVTVTNSGGCTATNSITINNSTAVTASANPTATTCGLNNGAATASATGGSGFSYAWSNGGNTASISNLAPGTYTVTATASNGCSGTQTITVGSSSGISVNASATSTACGLNNGTVSATPSGGSGYTYAWSNGGNTATQNNLAPGTYTVTVTSGAGCTQTATATVGNSSAISASATPQSTTCGLNNGTATASATGGSGYTYAWSNGGNSTTINNLAPGTYTVTVTATGGCTSTTAVTIGNSTAITASANPTATTCGLNNGSATASATGGSGFSYTWSNGGNTASISNLAPGTYTVTAIASNGCTSTTSVTVSGSTGITANTTAQNTNCGQNNGSATASGSGGTGTYTYLWSNGATTATVSGVAAGTYSVTVTDGAGCETISSVTVGSSNAVQASATSIATSCGLNNGSATATGSGGNGTFTYAWSNGASGATASGLAPGTYSVTVTDGAGCQNVATVTVQASTGLATTTTQANVSCAGQNDGSATANAPSGMTPLTFAWSTGATSSTISSLAPGTYQVTITDASGCTGLDTVTISEPTALTATTTGTDETGPGANDGSASVTPAGGTSPYTYNWSNGATTQTISNLAGGTYAATITDANGCITEIAITISTLTSVADGLNADHVTVFPNPSQGKFWVEYHFAQPEARELTVWNPLGQLIYTTRLVKAEGKVFVETQHIAAGTYQVVITSGNNRWVKPVIVK